MPHPQFRFLDTDADRAQLIADIQRTRRAVISIAEAIPPEQHALPQYHGWSLAALLAHLHFTDGFALTRLRLALVGIQLPLTHSGQNAINDLNALLMQRRVVETTVREIRLHEPRVVDFIMTLPLDRFSRPVYHPQTGSSVTIERALQLYFLFHWQEHLDTLRRGAGVFYEPPNDNDSYMV